MSRRTWRFLAWGGLGDAILLTPSLREIKAQHPRDRLLVYWTRPNHHAVLRGNPHIDGLYPASLRGAPLGYLGFSLGLLRPTPVDYGAYQPTFLYDQSHGRAAADLIADMLGIQLRDRRPEIFLTEAEKADGRARVADLARPVAIHVASTQCSNKAWPLERWAALIASRPDRSFVQIGLTREPLVPGAVDRRGCTIRETFAIVQACAAFLGIESGFAHAAAALGIPAVVLFGPSTPAIWGHPTTLALYDAQPCSPCLDLLKAAPCPYGTPCMSAISVGQVAAALDRQHPV